MAVADRLFLLTNMNRASQTSPIAAVSDIPITQTPKPKGEDRSCYTLRKFLLNVLWRIFDNVVLLQMGSTYLIRFHEFAMASDGRNDLLSIEEWRKEQQAEWDRLSPTVRRKYPPLISH